jgi:hypothetical protein
MIKSKKLFYLSLILFFIFMILNFPLLNQALHGEATSSTLSVPMTTGGKFIGFGIFKLVLLICALILFTISLKKYKGRGTVVALLIIMILPTVLANTYKKTLATGIYAVSYEKDASACTVSKIAERKMLMECELPFINYSNKGNEFSIQFYESFGMDESDPYVNLLALFNRNGPYKVKLLKEGSQTVKIRTEIKVSEKEEIIDGGEFHMLDIILTSDGKRRHL